MTMRIATVSIVFCLRIMMSILRRPGGTRTTEESGGLPPMGKLRIEGQSG
jgi:hypothetical protein